MPRSFPYEHFTVPPSGADPDRTRRAKQELSAQGEQEVRHGQVHYGKRFAETEAILHARAETRAKRGQPSPGAGQPPPPPKPRAGRVSTRSAATDRTPPLGATPTAELPPAADEDLAQTPLQLLEAFRDQALRSIEGVSGAARQLQKAGLEMARLPLEAVRLLIRIGRTWLGEPPRRA